MTFSACSYRSVFITTICTIALIGLLPIRALSQEPSDTGSRSESTEAHTQKEYTTEFLPGDEVVGDFVVGPGKTELFLAPGESARVELIVTNRTGSLREFNFEVEDVTGTDNPERTVVLLGDDQGPYTLKDYIELPEESINLKHNERARIPITISIPPDAEPGGRYGSVLVTTVSKDAEAGNTSGTAPQSAIISRIGSLFFVVIDGDAEVEGALEGFATIPEKQWFFEGPIPFGIYFRNTGSIHLNPYGEMRIANIFGQEVGFLEIEPWFALPNSLRFREVTWDRAFLLGKYTARIDINRGYDDVIDTLYYTFWVFPWKLLLAVFMGIFIVVFFIRFFTRTFEFRRKGTDGETDN